MKRFLLWDFPRGVWQYDVMVALILAFIFLTPREIFRDYPRASNIVRLFCTRAVPLIVRSVKVGVKVLAPVTSFDSIFIFTCTSRFGNTVGVKLSVSPVGS